MKTRICRVCQQPFEPRRPMQPDCSPRCATAEARRRRREKDGRERWTRRGPRRGAEHPMWRGGPQASYGKDWPRIAEAVRTRDHRTCQACGKPESINLEETGKRLVVDHIRPRRDFADPRDADRVENLISVCARCHGRKTARAETSFRKGDVLAQQQYERAIRLPGVRA